MPHTLTRVAVALFLALLSVAHTAAQAPSKDSVGPDRSFDLMVGDAAPPLSIDKWIKGESFKAFERDRVYVVEFWSTWCPPCIEGMPHTTELQKKYQDKGVTIVGVTKSDPQNSLAAVERLVKDNGDAVGYAIAYDQGRTTFDAWMTAAGQNEIPCAFIVNRSGVIAAILQPDVEDLEQPLEQIVSGEWKVAEAASRYQERIEKSAKRWLLEKQLGEARKRKDWSVALQLCDDLLALDAEKFAVVAADKFQILLLELKDAERAYAWARTAIDGVVKNDARALNRIAYPIVDPKNDVNIKDLDLAMKAALRANELKKGEGPYVLQTVARIHFVKGDIDKAMETQAKATDLADAENKSVFQRILDEYKKAAEH